MGSVRSLLGRSPQSRKRPAQIAPRRLAIDVLRGFCLWNMFVNRGLIRTLPRLPPSSHWGFVLRPFTHAEWNGFHLADANFPAFMALIGTSMVLSYHNRCRHGATKRTYVLKVCKRFCFMVGFAAYFQYVDQDGIFDELACCILFSGLLMLSLTPRALIVSLVVVLLAQWAVMAWLPVPGHGAGDYSRGANAETYVQSMTASAIAAGLGLKPEHYGIAELIARDAVFPTRLATFIIGLLLGYILLSNMPYRRQAIVIGGLGSLAMALGYAWDAWCPLNKHLWTPSFALFAAGILFLFLAAFIQVCEVWNYRNLVWICSWVGRSPLLAVFWFFSVPLLHDVAQQLADIITPGTFEAQPLVVTVIQIALAAPCFAISRLCFERLRARRSRAATSVGHSPVAPTAWFYG
jgi:predicted acyltransferase